MHPLIALTAFRDLLRHVDLDPVPVELLTPVMVAEEAGAAEQKYYAYASKWHAEH